MEKFQNRYRIPSNRKPNWDYSHVAFYYLTICTQHRVPILGDIIRADGIVKMQLSDFGKIVESEWIRSFKIRQELILHEWVIMPDHIHAIVEIRGNDGGPVDTGGVVDTHGVDTHGVDTHGRAYQQRRPRSISSFMAGFKSAVNNSVDNYIDEHRLDIPKYNRHNHFFQPNYNDHIIRDHRAFYTIALSLDNV